MSGKRARERTIFERFLNLEPAFAGERIADWRQPDDEREFPDIIAVSASDRRIGVELGEWLNEDEIRAAKQQENLEESFIAAIGDQGQNPTQHIEFVWLHPKPKSRLAAADVEAFREQIFACVGECDRRWPNEPYWRRGHRLPGEELSGYPMLRKYLDGMQLWPSNGPPAPRDHWITFPMRGGSFDRDTMLAPLRSLVSEKVSHYASRRTSFDHLSLVVFYNLALLYNSPAETPLHSFEDAAANIRQLLAENRGPFHSVFLFLAIGEGRVLRVC